MVVISAIDGTAGVGKTALAVHWAHRVRDRFPDGQLYVNLRGFAAGPPVAAIDALAGFLRALGLAEERIPVHVEEAAALFRSLLAGRRVLVVLDNAVDAAQVRPLLPAGGGCLALVTSRSRLAGLVARDGATRINLDVLAVEEAGALLARILGSERVAREPDAVAGLAHACAYLPLALRIAAANLLDRADLDIGDYVADLLKGDRLAALEVDGDAEAAVKTTFDLSYARLDPHAQRLFRCIGLVTGPDVTVEAAAALTGTPAQQARRLLDRLAAAHLLDQATTGRYTCHDLLRLYAAERAGDDPAAERQAALQRLYDHYLQRVDAAAEKLYPQMLRLPGAAPSTSVPPDAGFDGVGQALAWLDAERPNLIAAITHTARHGPPAVAWRLTDALRGYFYQGMYAVDWLTALQAAQAAAAAVGDLRAQAATELGLGTYHWSQSHFRQAIDRHTRMVDLARRSGWTDGEGAAVGNLGGLYQAVGQQQRAVEHITQAVGLTRRAGRLGGQALHLTNLGIAQCLLGQLEQAASNHVESLALFRQIGARGGEATALSNLAVARHQLGRLDDARDRLDLALALHREVGDRTKEAEALICLALVHCDLGRYDQALELARTGLALSQDTGRRMDQASALTALATVHHRLGDQRQAVDGHRQAVRLARDANYPQIQTEGLLGLADSLLSLGETGTALTRARHALTLARRLGYQVFEGQALTLLTAIHHRLGDQRQAAEHAQQALTNHRRTGHRLGEARTHLVLGHILRATDRVEQAEEHWRVALDLFTAIGVPEADDARVLLNGQRSPGLSPAST
jgi:tetratricopeptide (TPR) repeat protein